MHLGPWPYFSWKQEEKVNSKTKWFCKSRLGLLRELVEQVDELVTVLTNRLVGWLESNDESWSTIESFLSKSKSTN